MNILFINGVNTSFGGSGANALENWMQSISKKKFNVLILNTVPTFGIKKKDFLLKILLVLFFFPGSIIRIIKNPLAEIFYKISPFLFLYLLYKSIFYKYKYVVLSHYCIFIYYFIYRKSSRIFIIQDLLYIRAKSLKYSRGFCKFIFKFEIFIYKMSQNIICLSYDEERILRKFLKARMSLVTCLNSKSLNITPSFSEINNRIAVVSDWRRAENVHGLLTFFTEAKVSTGVVESIEFWIYGISSEVALSLLNANSTLKSHKFFNGGEFNSYDDIPTKFFLIPIYQGAGIKLKTLEMLSNGRFIFGTPGAFIGIPRFSIKQYSKIVSMPSEIIPNYSISPIEIQKRFISLHNSKFNTMGEYLNKIAS